MEAIQRNGSPNRKSATIAKATGFPALSGGRVFASCTWEVIDSRAKVVRELRSVGRDDVVYLATDLDRKRETIAWHLRDLLGESEDRFRRVTFSEITPAAVRAAFERPQADRLRLGACPAGAAVPGPGGRVYGVAAAEPAAAGRPVGGRVQSAVLAILGRPGREDPGLRRCRLGGSTQPLAC